MKAIRLYECNRVMVYVSEGDFNTCITFESEAQMRRMGECLKDLARTGCGEVNIEER